MRKNEKQLHIRLPSEVFTQLKIKCASEAISIQDYVAKQVETSISSDLYRRQPASNLKTTKSHILKIFRGFHIFRDVAENDLVKLADATIVLHFKKRKIIIRENEIATSFYIIEKGMVKLFKNLPMGKEFITALRGEGETFAPNSIIKGIPNFASATAFEDTSLLAVRREDFLKFVNRNPVVKSRIADLDRETIDSFFEKMIDLSSAKAARRLIKVLSLLTDKYGKTLYFTHQEIAELSLTSIETITRCLNQLKNRRIIETSRGKITIIDREKLCE